MSNLERTDTCGDHTQTIKIAPSESGKPKPNEWRSTSTYCWSKSPISKRKLKFLGALCITCGCTLMLWWSFEICWKHLQILDSWRFTCSIYQRPQVISTYNAVSSSPPQTCQPRSQHAQEILSTESPWLASWSPVRSLCTSAKGRWCGRRIGIGMTQG